MGGPGKRRWDCQDLRLRVHPKQSGDGTPAPIRSHDPCRLPGDFMISHGGKPWKRVIELLWYLMGFYGKTRRMYTVHLDLLAESIILGIFSHWDVHYDLGILFGEPVPFLDGSLSISKVILCSWMLKTSRCSQHCSWVQRSMQCELKSLEICGWAVRKASRLAFRIQWLVGGFKHFLFSIIYETILPID